MVKSLADFFGGRLDIAGIIISCHYELLLMK